MKATVRIHLKVWYRSGVAVNLGNELTPIQVKDVPEVSWKAEKRAYYTLVMTNADSSFREFRHWLVFNIVGCDIKSGDEVFDYVTAPVLQLANKYNLFGPIFGNFFRAQYKP